MPKRRPYEEPETRRKLLDAVRRGLDVPGIAAELGVSDYTLQRWIKQDQVLALDVRNAQAEAQATGTARQTDAVKPTPNDRQGADRWRKLKEEAASFAPGMLGFLYAVDARLAARQGAHALSPFWRERLTEFYQSGKSTLLACVGRGGGKSDSQTTVVVAECIFAPRAVPPGETWIWPYLSKDMSETNLKFGPLISALDAVGLGDSERRIHRRKDGRSEIAFEDASGNSIEVRVYPNTKDALRGPTLCGATNDEEAFWRADKELGTSTADDVLDAMAPAFRGDAKEKKHLRISSANRPDSTLMVDIKNGDDELHFVARLGRFVDDAKAGFERVAAWLREHNKHEDARAIMAWSDSLTDESPWIPSWVGNPTHDALGGFLRIRKRLAKWLREHGSMPRDDAEEGDVFDALALDRAVAATAYPGRGERFAAIDTGASRNPTALAIVERVEHRGAYQWRPILLKQWMRKPGGLPLDLRGKVLPEIARLVKAYGCEPAWWSDGWSSHDTELVAAEHGLRTIFVSTSTVYRDLCAPLESALALERGDAVVLAGCEGAAEAVRQLRGVRRSSSGGVIWPEVGAEHAELAQVLLRALAHAELGKVPPRPGATRPSFFGDRYSSFR